MRITSLAVHRRIATSVIVAALVVLGLYGLWRLPVDFLPDFTYPMIKVHIWWRGATPEEVNDNIADPIERQMATVDDLDYLESSCIEGMYALQANFKYGVDVNTAYQDALAAMARVARELPKDIDPPVVIKADPSQLPVLQLAISSDRWDMVKLRDWTDRFLQDQLLAVAGVAGTEIVGGLKREIRVHLSPDILEKHRLPLATVLKRLRDENIEQFGGRVTEGRREYIARTVGRFQSLDDIRSVVVAGEGLGRVYLRDIASVEDAHEEVRVITRMDGQPCVKLSVLRQANANTVEVAKAVGRRLKELDPLLPAGMHIAMVENQADYVGSALSSVRDAAVGAAVLVIIVTYAFLGSWRQALVMAIGLPVTIILNFGLMKLAGFSLNIFSMGGLVVALGVVLDNSTVVLENITRLRSERKDASPLDAAVAGAAEVGPAVLAATLSFLALFLPFLLVPGLMSLLFRELILVIAGIVVISLATAITFTPMLASLLVGGGSKLAAGQPQAGWFERAFARVTEAYGRALHVMLRGRWAAIVLFLIILGGGVLLSPRLGSEFLPTVDDGRVMVKVRLPTGASVAETDKLLARVESAIAGDSLIESFFTLAGGKVWGLYTYEIANEGEINIQLVPRGRRTITTNDYIRRLRPVVSKISVPGGKTMVMQAKVKGIHKIGDADIEVKIRGQDVPTLFTLARRTAEAMNTLGHFANVYVSMDMTKPEYQVEVDRAKAAELGVSVDDVAASLRALISGAVATEYMDGDEYYNVRVMVPERKMAARRDVENLVLDGALGEHVRLHEIAAVRPAVGPVEIAREDQVKQVIVRGDAAGASVGQALAELKAALASVQPPAGYELSFGGQAQMMADMRQSILAILAFAVFFAFVVLAVQFNDIKLPALILGSVPVCAAGMVYALYLTGLPMGATVIIGVLVVVAATVNDGVLLLTFANELRAAGEPSPRDAVVKAARIRLRPRVMTTVSTMAGVVPLAMSIGEGGDMLKPMAVGALGGLGLEIAVALFLMPCLYLIFTRKGPARAD